MHRGASCQNRYGNQLLFNIIHIVSVSVYFYLFLDKCAHACIDLFAHSFVTPRMCSTWLKHQKTLVCVSLWAFLLHHSLYTCRFGWKHFMLSSLPGSQSRTVDSSRLETVTKTQTSCEALRANSLSMKAKQKALLARRWRFMPRRLNSDLRAAIFW